MRRCPLPALHAFAGLLQAASIIAGAAAPATNKKIDSGLAWSDFQRQFIENRWRFFQACATQARLFAAIRYATAAAWVENVAGEPARQASIRKNRVRWGPVGTTGQLRRKLEHVEAGDPGDFRGGYFLAG